jgi:hypothetical protein
MGLGPLCSSWKLASPMSARSSLQLYAHILNNRRLSLYYPLGPSGRSPRASELECRWRYDYAFNLLLPYITRPKHIRSLRTRK